MRWQDVADRLFPQGHSVQQDGEYLSGEGRNGDVVFDVVGTTQHAEVGVELSLRMAAAVLATVREHPQRPILFLLDTKGQRLRRRDELLGINRYMAHLGKCVEIARQRGHRTVALIYDQALSGGFIASGMMADVCGATPDAEIRVMSLPGMARVTRIAEERLLALSATSPVFAPGAENYVRMGAIDALWDDLPHALRTALAHADGIDHRRELGFARGGRMLASPVAERVSRAP